MAIGIATIASYVPAGRESNLDKRERFGIDEAFIRDKLGVVRVSRMGATEDTADLCVAAYSRLMEQVALPPASVELIVVCTQNPDGHGIPHSAAVVQGRIGAPDTCACFDIALGCSGYVYGLSICQAFMAANGLSTGLFFTADPYSKILDPADKSTALLFGDAATVTLLKARTAPQMWVPHGFRFATRGSEGACLVNDAGTLRMNGRAVFNFSAVEVPKQVQQVLTGAGLATDDVDIFLFHQGSKYIVDTLTRRLGLPPERVPSNLADQGNTVSSSLPLLLAPLLFRPGLQRVLLSGFGVGLSWATCLLERVPQSKENSA
jgi:3-oxoacyl-[acyl-carrier-protein] synthase III